MTEAFIGAISRIIGLLGLIYATRVFGASAETDFIYFSSALIVTIIGVFAAINGNIVMPQIIIFQREANEVASWKLICSIFTYTTLFIVILMVIFYYFFNEILFSLSNFQTKLILQSDYLIIILVLTIYVSYVADLLSNIFKGYRNFLIPNLAMAFGSTAGFISLILSSRFFGPVSIIFSLLISQAVQAIFLWISLIKSNKILIFEFSLFPNASNVFNLLPPLLLNQLCAAIVVIYPNYLLSGLDGGELTAITLARRIFELIPALIIIPIVSALAPMLSDLVGGEHKSLISEKISKINEVLFSAVIPISIFIIFYSDLVVSLTLEGKSNDALHLEITSTALKWYCISLMALASNAVITRALVMTQNIKIAYISLVFAILPAIGIPLFTKYGIIYFGSIGVASGHSLYLILIHQIIGYIILKKIIGNFIFTRELKAIAIPLISSLIAGFLSLSVMTFFNQVSLFALITISIIFAIIYILIHILLQTNSYLMIKGIINDFKSTFQSD